MLVRRVLRRGMNVGVQTEYLDKLEFISVPSLNLQSIYSHS